MQIATYLAQLTGFPSSTLFAPANPLARISSTGGVFSVDYWNVPGVAQPTPAQLAAAVAAADPAPAASSLKNYAAAKADALLSAMRPYSVSGVTIKADATDGTIAQLLALAQWGTANLTASENWIANDLSVTAVTGAEFVALAPLVGAYAQLIYGTQLAAVLAQIGSATITTTAQIDAYAWTA